MAGVALTLSNAKAVMEALVGHQTAFARTPKYGIGKIASKEKYKSKIGSLPYFELLAGSYFVLMIWYSVETYNFLAIPFLSLFVGGYFWAATSKFWFEYQNKQAFEKARQMQVEGAR